MKRSPLKRKTGFSKTRKRIGPGKKTREWNKIRAELKKRFLSVGITRCEMCGKDNMLSFAHRKKRRFCDEDELHVCALLCNPCHDKLEALPHDQMYYAVNRIIKSRKVHP